MGVGRYTAEKFLLGAGIGIGAGIGFWVLGKYLLPAIQAARARAQYYETPSGEALGGF